PGKTVKNGTCTVNNQSGCDGRNSRLFASKSALSNAVNAYGGDIDFGLETFDFQLGKFNAPLCEPCIIQCIGMSCGYTRLYTAHAFTTLLPTNWQSQGCTGPGGGGRIVVTPAANSGVQILPWLDGVEVHTSSNDGNNSYGTGSTPTNPEIRAEGNTPIAQSL